MLMNSQDADLFGKNFCQDLLETVKIPDKTQLHANETLSKWLLT